MESNSICPSIGCQAHRHTAVARLQPGTRDRLLRQQRQAHCKGIRWRRHTLDGRVDGPVVRQTEDTGDLDVRWELLLAAALPFSCMVRRRTSSRAPLTRRRAFTPDTSQPVVLTSMTCGASGKASARTLQPLDRACDLQRVPPRWDAHVAHAARVRASESNSVRVGISARFAFLRRSASPASQGGESGTVCASTSTPLSIATLTPSRVCGCAKTGKP